MILLEGRQAVAKLREEIELEKEKLQAYVPKLAIVRVGEREDDIAYEKAATKRLDILGLAVESFVFEKEISHEEFEKEFLKINDDISIDGILLLRPLPKQIDEKRIESLIDINKDLDCISPQNIAKVFTGEEGFAPCTARAVVELLKAYDVDLKGKHIVVIGRSMVIGKPFAMLALKEDATISICHSKTENINEITKRADIIVAAIGKAEFVDDTYVSEHQILVDVGINFKAEKMCGDIDFEKVRNRVSMISPVPGGVGGVTTSILALHLVKSAIKKK